MAPFKRRLESADFFLISDTGKKIYRGRLLGSAGFRISMVDLSGGRECGVRIALYTAVDVRVNGT